MTCIVVDDEPLAREGLANLIETRNELELQGSFKNVRETQAFLSRHSVDLVFLDIEMPGINGLQFAQDIPADTLIVFTTAYKEYAYDSYKVNALDYLLKPIAKEEFDRTVTKAFSVAKIIKKDVTNIEEIGEDFVFIKSDRRYYKVLFDKILFIEGMKDYVIIHTENNRIMPAMNLKTIHKELPRSKFIRVSKSYIVNEKAIDSFDAHTIYINKHEIPIGKVYRENFQKHYLGKEL